MDDFEDETKFGCYIDILKNISFISFKRIPCEKIITNIFAYSFLSEHSQHMFFFLKGMFRNAKIYVIICL